jgi:hypothetical protein
MALARRNLPDRPPRFHSQWRVKISEAQGMTHGLSLASAFGNVCRHIRCSDRTSSRRTLREGWRHPLNGSGQTEALGELPHESPDNLNGLLSLEGVGMSVHGRSLHLLQCGNSSAIEGTADVPFTGRHLGKVGVPGVIGWIGFAKAVGRHPINLFLCELHHTHPSSAALWSARLRSQGALP